MLKRARNFLKKMIVNKLDHLQKIGLSNNHGLSILNSKQTDKEYLSRNLKCRLNVNHDVNTITNAFFNVLRERTSINVNYFFRILPIALSRGNLDVDEEEFDEKLSYEHFDSNKMKYHDTILQLRNISFELPPNVKLLENPCGSKVYLIGTSHVSAKSAQEVVNIIEKTVPDNIILELCERRINFMLKSEATWKKEIENSNLKYFIRNFSPINMINIYLKFLMKYILKKSGNLPGREVKAAYEKARELPCCRIVFGDRPINITFNRIWHSLKFSEIIKLQFFAFPKKVKAAIKKDSEVLKSEYMTKFLLGRFKEHSPSLYEVIVNERDQYLTRSIWDVVQPLDKEGRIPSLSVAIVGTGHLDGIINYWDKAADIDLKLLSRTFDRKSS